MEGVKVVSMNVNGLNISYKRRAIFKHLRKARADIFLIQETHCTSDTEKIWKQEWGAPAYFCNGSKSSKGVAILMSRELSFKVIEHRSDEIGRLLCMDVEIDGVVYTLGSLYVPTQDKGKEQISFLESIDEILVQANSTNIILGGDFNHPIDPSLDRNSRTATPPYAEQVGQKLAILTEEWGLCDVWRIRNSASPGYTFRRGTYASRLDYFLISDPCQTWFSLPNSTS